MCACKSLTKTGEQGFSLLELLVAGFVSVLVVGGMLLVFSGLRDVERDQMQLIDAQMTARLAMERMRRDLQVAGVGLAGMLSPVPIIEPRADGGVDVHHNPENLTARLVTDMAGPSADLVVDNAAGFLPGMPVIVFDSTGTYDIATLTSVSGTSLAPSGSLSKAYRAAQGAAVKQVQTISYSLQAANGVFSLWRQVDAGPPQPVAENVRSMSIVYFDDATPAQPFTPATIADQLRVTAVEIALEVETEDERLNTSDERTVTVRARVASRSSIFSS